MGTALKAVVLLVAAVGTFVAGWLIGTPRRARPSGLAAYATCGDDRLPEVWYTPPVATKDPLQISTSIAGRPLASWTETPGGPHSPVVIGLPTTDEGSVFVVDAGLQRTEVQLPNCP